MKLTHPKTKSQFTLSIPDFTPSETEVMEHLEQRMKLRRPIVKRVAKDQQADEGEIILPVAGFTLIPTEQHRQEVAHKKALEWKKGIVGRVNADHFCDHAPGTFYLKDIVITRGRVTHIVTQTPVTATFEAIEMDPILNPTKV